MQSISAYRAFKSINVIMTVFYLLEQLTKAYPEILTPENIWIIGITQESFTREYYLVFYHDVHALVNSFIRLDDSVKYMQYRDFYELNEIGSGGYATVYTAKYKNYSEEDMPQTVVLKRFKSFDGTQELFISEVSNLQFKLLSN